MYMIEAVFGNGASDTLPSAKTAGLIVVTVLSEEFLQTGKISLQQTYLKPIHVDSRGQTPPLDYIGRREGIFLSTVNLTAITSTDANLTCVIARNKVHYR